MNLIGYPTMGYIHNKRYIYMHVTTKKHTDRQKYEQGLLGESL